MECGILEGNLYSLIWRLQTDDESAFEALKVQYEGLLHSQVSQVIGRIPNGEFDDLMQEASLALFHAAMRFDLTQDDVTFGLYAKICIRNRLISVARRANKPKLPTTSLTADEEPSASERKAARRSSFRELNEAAEVLLSSMEYAVFQLYLDGCSAAEIAKIMDKSPKSIDNAIYRMRKKLKDQRNVIAAPNDNRAESSM